ncbi:MAG: hypothetical protein CTY29_07255 [Methylobacter sp.]|nr:MAG: hypothetical protein CTY29_07255 [Methylobacter sp.]PPD20141.1 MAG: hypothetical protein CTY24_09735 [Methylobacter sp.]
MINRFLPKNPTQVSILSGPFQGAKMYLNLNTSKRKIFGLYEYVLNDWILKKIINKQFVLDIGANTGYDTYGFAHLLIKNGATNPFVLSFEPDDYIELSTPKDWSTYKKCKIELIKKYVGAISNEQTITIDDAFSKYAPYLNGNGIIKMDIEGGEIEALKGASNTLNNSNLDWLIEIHGKHLIPEVAKFFVDRSRPFLIKELQPLPIIGHENRQIFTTWLVTI